MCRGRIGDSGAIKVVERVAVVVVMMGGKLGGSWSTKVQCVGRSGKSQRGFEVFSHFERGYTWQAQGFGELAVKFGALLCKVSCAPKLGVKVLTAA